MSNLLKVLSVLKSVAFVVFIFVVLFIILYLNAFMHEKDIYFSCLEHGTSGQAAMYKEFKCQVE